MIKIIIGIIIIIFIISTIINSILYLYINNKINNIHLAIALTLYFFGGPVGTIGFIYIIKYIKIHGTIDLNDLF